MMSHGMRLVLTVVTSTTALLAMPGMAEERTQVAQVEELSRMSLQELAQVEVMSVAKSAQLLSEAPAAIYVITREEILRSGVRSIPEALRLAPNLQVVQFSATSYGITARGFGDKREVQTQANKLLILIDGRTVYSPLFSGVFYDQLEVLMDDVERIEVISGPGATLWGANAMNGVINVITRPAAETGGALVRVGAGDEEQALSARYGDTIGDDAAYRVYAKAFERGSVDLADGASARDRWNKMQGGFRLDWGRGKNAFTFQGDVFHADQSLLTVPQITMTGGNALARWERTSDRSHLSVLAYYDRSDREAPPDGAPFVLDTFNLEIQQSLQLGRHGIVWGAGTRLNDYEVENLGALQFRPAHRSLKQGNVFVQDTLSFGESVQLTAGVKLEDNPYVDWTALPDVRLAWAPKDTVLLWAAASRAIRAPTPFDVDVAELVGGTVFLAGNPLFRSEEVTAYQIGYRGEARSRMSLSLSAFYNVYDDVRTVEPSPVVILPLLWSNLLEGDTYGVEGWANIQVTPRWRLSPGFRTLKKQLRFKPGASGLLDEEQPGNDPTMQASLKSSTDFGRGLTLDAFLRYVDELPDPLTPDYYELSARFAWRVSGGLEVSLSGFNLLDESHNEYVAPTGLAIPRSIFAEARLTF